MTSKDVSPPKYSFTARGGEMGGGEGGSWLGPIKLLTQRGGRRGRRGWRGGDGYTQNINTWAPTLRRGCVQIATRDSNINKSTYTIRALTTVNNYRASLHCDFVSVSDPVFIPGLSE